MAQEVAGAMKQVNAARSAVARRRAVAAATELILSLWEHRSRWPQGWPPRGAELRVGLLTTRAHPYQPPPATTGSAWIDRAEELFRISTEEYQLAYAMGLIEQGVDDSRQAVEAAGPYLAGDNEPADIAALRREVELHDELLRSAGGAGAKTKAAIRQFADREFKRLASERRKLLQELLSSRPRRRRA